MNQPDSSEPLTASPVPAPRKPFAAPPPNLTPAQLDQHHRQQLFGVTKWQGLDGAAAYRGQFPEAARIVSKSNPVTFIPRPAGYNDAVARIVGKWLTDPEATSRTNRQDVTTLNASMGQPRFNPDSHFSRPVGAQLRKRLAGMFEQRGYQLPGAAETLSKIKQAAKAARAVGQPCARTYGAIGTLTADALTIGGQSFRIERHHGNECIRLTVKGQQQRLRLDALTELLCLTGLLTGKPPEPPLSSIVDRGRISPGAENGDPAEGQSAILPENKSRPVIPDSDPPGELVPDTLADTDPLEFSAADLEALRQLQSGNS